MEREEEDLLGTVKFNDACLYGIATERALRCSSVGAPKVPKIFIQHVGLVKYACALSNKRLGLLTADKGEAIAEAALEIYRDEIDGDAFPLEIFQTGGCTPTNMNVNEVIKNLVFKRSGIKINANDDCNRCQSTNDVIPTALNITVREICKHQLIPSLQGCCQRLQEKEKEWAEITILGRTHTMDAVLMTLGQVFSGYRRQIEKDIENILNNLPRFLELPIGGTAVGNGINGHPRFAENVIRILNERLNESYVASVNRYEQQSSRDDYVLFAGLLDTVTTSLIKIANDIRWYGSGPTGGINELVLPATQAGSSCMPGKVNPVVCETLLQACIYVQGNCNMIRQCAIIGGQFQLNTTSMLLIYSLVKSLQTLSDALDLFSEKLLQDLQANEKVIASHVGSSYALLNKLVPHIGYDEAARVVQEAKSSQISVVDILKKRYPQFQREILNDDI